MAHSIARFAAQAICLLVSSTCAHAQIDPIFKSSFDGGPRLELVQVDAPPGWIVTSEFGGAAGNQVLVDRNRLTFVIARPYNGQDLTLLGVVGTESALQLTPESTAIASVMALPLLAESAPERLAQIAAAIRSEDAYWNLMGNIANRGGLVPEGLSEIDSIASIYYALLPADGMTAKNIVSPSEPFYQVTDDPLVVAPGDFLAASGAYALYERPRNILDLDPVATLVGQNREVAVVDGTVTKRLEPNTSKLSGDIADFIQGKLLEGLSLEPLSGFDRSARFGGVVPGVVRVFSGKGLSSAPDAWNEAAKSAYALNISSFVVTAMLSLHDVIAVSSPANAADCDQKMRQAVVAKILQEQLSLAINPTTSELSTQVFSLLKVATNTFLQECVVTTAVVPTFVSRITDAVATLASNGNPLAKGLLTFDAMSAPMKIFASYYRAPALQTYVKAQAAGTWVANVDDSVLSNVKPTGEIVTLGTAFDHRVGSASTDCTDDPVGHIHLAAPSGDFFTLEIEGFNHANGHFENISCDVYDPALMAYVQQDTIDIHLSNPAALGLSAACADGGVPGCFRVYKMSLDVTVPDLLNLDPELPEPTPRALSATGTVSIEVCPSPQGASDTVFCTALTRLVDIPVSMKEIPFRNE